MELLCLPGLSEGPQEGWEAAQLPAALLIKECRWGPFELTT